jgi:hypothetical protein
MRQRRRRAFDRGTGGDGQDSAGRVPARIPGAAAVRVPFAATIDGISFAATIDWVSFAVGIRVSLAVGIRVSLAAAFVGVSGAASASATATATATAGVSAGVVAGVGAGPAAWIHRSAASRQVVRQLGKQRR